MLSHLDRHLQPHAGPRHIEFAPGGRQAYTVNELDNTMTVYDYSPATGALRTAQTLSTLPPGWTAPKPTEVYSAPSHASELLLSTDGRFCYVSNRGHDSVVVFAVAATTGRLAAVQWQPCGGRIPWAMTFAGGPEAPFLVVQNTHSRGGGLNGPMQVPDTCLSQRSHRVRRGSHSSCHHTRPPCTGYARARLPQWLSSVTLHPGCSRPLALWPSCRRRSRL